MERIIGVLLLAGSLFVLVTLHNDARAQGWRWRARIVLYGSAVTVSVLAVLIALGSTQAARLMFVGIGTVLIAVMLLVGGLALAAGIVALRDRRRNPRNTPKR